jgi:hypothetical protein
VRAIIGAAFAAERAAIIREIEGSHAASDGDTSTAVARPHPAGEGFEPRSVAPRARPVAPQDAGPGGSGATPRRPARPVSA